MKLNIHFDINQNIFLRDPQETKLGQRIVNESIILIHQLGFEAFTFKKLSERIDSTEASVYRYFESKHKLLIYLVAWYWEWIHFKIIYFNNNIIAPEQKLNTILKTLSDLFEDDLETELNENLLHEIIITESAKSFHIKNIDDENKKGLFKNYKNLILYISSVIKEINPQYQFSNSLATILVDTAISHPYYAAHLPTLVNKNQQKASEQTYTFLKHISQSMLESHL